jgi:hypothetical protein
MEFPWLTVAPLLLLTVVKLPSYTFTPLATELLDELTTSTPLEPSSAVPLRSTVPVFVDVTDEPLAAMEPPADADGSVAPAVTLSICLSLMALAFGLLVDVGCVLWE